MEVIYPDDFEADQCFQFPYEEYTYFKFNGLKLRYTNPATGVQKECPILRYFSSLEASTFSDPWSSIQLDKKEVASSLLGYDSTAIVQDTDLMFKRYYSSTSFHDNGKAEFYFAFLALSNKRDWYNLYLTWYQYTPAKPMSFRKYVYYGDSILKVDGTDVWRIEKEFYAPTKDQQLIFSFNEGDFYHGCSGKEFDEARVCKIDSIDDFECEGLPSLTYPSSSCSEAGLCRAVDINVEEPGTIEFDINLRLAGDSKWGKSAPFRITVSCGLQTISTTQTDYTYPALARDGSKTEVLNFFEFFTAFSSDTPACPPVKI